MSDAATRYGRTKARAIIGLTVYLTGVALMLYAVPANTNTYLPGGLLAGVGAGLQGPALHTLWRARRRRRRLFKNRSCTHENAAVVPEG